MKYNCEKGNLFDLPKDQYVFAHCIAADLKWGAGIAPIIIEKEFNATKYCRYEKDGGVLPDGALSVGAAFAVPTEKGILVNLITKEHTYEKPTYDTLRKSLYALRAYLSKTDYNKLAIPKIGCGLDKLEWPKVESILKTIFADTDLEIEVRYL